VRISLSTTDAQRKTPELEKGNKFKFTCREKRAGKQANRGTRDRGSLRMSVA